MRDTCAYERSRRLKRGEGGLGATFEIGVAGSLRSGASTRPPPRATSYLKLLHNTHPPP